MSTAHRDLGKYSSYVTFNLLPVALVLWLKSIIMKIKTNTKNLHFNKHLFEAVLILKKSMIAIVGTVQYFKNFQTCSRNRIYLRLQVLKKERFPFSGSC
jgi:uncharacterized membrane protein YidH (DUF202 family)